MKRLLERVIYFIKRVANTCQIETAVMVGKLKQRNLRGSAQAE